MNEKLINQYIESLSEKLGVAAEHIYEALYKQQYFEGITNLVICFVFLVLLISSVKFVINIYTKSIFERTDEGYFGKIKPMNTWAKINNSEFVEGQYIWIIFGIVWVVLVTVIICTSIDGTLKLLNPEYYALKEILDVFSK